MSLLTPILRAALLANGAAEVETDHVPLAKFVNPVGPGRWLVTELADDGDTLFGLADLGFPELGSFSLSEMESVRLPLGLSIVCDPLFATALPLSVWTAAARRTGSIAQAETLLKIIARRDGRPS